MTVTIKNFTTTLGSAGSGAANIMAYAAPALTSAIVKTIVVTNMQSVPIVFGVNVYDSSKTLTSTIIANRTLAVGASLKVVQPIYLETDDRIYITSTIAGVSTAVGAVVELS